jgi:hypothetical protein
MEFQDFIQNSLIHDYNPSLQNELNKIDNLIENNFQNRCDNSNKKDKKFINKIKLYLYNNEFEDDEQKQINKLLTILGKNYKQKGKSQFRPLSKPKKVSLAGKIFINNNSNDGNIIINEKEMNGNILNNIKN